MKTKMMIVVLLALIGCSASEKKTAQNETNKAITSSNLLEGTWVLKYVLMGDAMDAPCGFNNEGKVKEMTLTFASAENGMLILNGQSSVNAFSGKYQIISYDENSKTGKIKIENLVSTKMAAIDDEIMACETRYFTYLQNTEDFKIEDGKLELIKSTPLPKSDLGNAPFGESYKSVLYFDTK